MRLARIALLVLLVPLVAAACGPTAEAEPPAGTSPSDAPVVPAVPRACLGLDDLECVRAFDVAIGALTPAERSQLVYVEVGPFGCRTGQDCPPNLAARPEGMVMFELGAGDPRAVQLTPTSEEGVLGIIEAEAFTVRVDPSSARGQLTGEPIPFSLGHCGLGSGVDVDGSWWDPIGFVDSDHGDAINAGDGIFAPVDPNRAVFTTPGGLSVELLRRAGPKHLPLCQ
jgi:hypothetical protein